MKKILLLVSILLLTATHSLWAGPIDENRAREIALAFFSGKATRSAGVDVELEWAGRSITTGTATTFSSTATTKGDATLYIYNRTDNRGFVIVAGRDCANPIIAYSDKKDFNYEDMAESTRAILAAWSHQVEAYTDEDYSSFDATQLAAESYGDVLCNYNSALWDQGEPYNRECPVIDGYRSVTGCVATSMAIVCYHNRWPEKGTGTTMAYSYTDDYDKKEHYIAANALGRTYDYDKMLHSYSDSYTKAQGDAVAALMYDMGTSVQMMYHYYASGTFSEYIAGAMSTYFGYSKEALLLKRDRYSANEWHTMLKENLDKCGPMPYGGASQEGGHAFVVDGYTSKNYFHFNFGWSGHNNGFYRTPDIEYYDSQDAIFNLMPDKNGTTEYVDYLTLIDYQYGQQYFYGIMPSIENIEYGTSFNVDLGCIYNEGNTDFNGSIAIAVCDKFGNIKEILQEKSLTSFRSQYLSYDTFRGLTLSTVPQPGDVLRALYKGNNPDEWQWMRKASDAVVDEIVLCEDTGALDKALTLSFHKNYDGNNTKAIMFSSIVDIDYEWKSSTGTVIASGHLEAGTSRLLLFEQDRHDSFILQVSRDGESHSINVKI